MGDEFVEHDLGTPSEAELDAAYSSQYLGVVDVGPKKIKTTLAKVTMQEIKDRNSGKPRKRAVVYFENIDKPLILNTVNRNILIDGLGKNPAGWRGAGIGVFVDPNVSFGGKQTGGVRLRVLLPPAAAKPAAPAPKPAPVKSAPAAATPPAAEVGDPGPAFDPDLTPDFEPAE